MSFLPLKKLQTWSKFTRTRSETRFGMVAFLPSGLGHESSASEKATSWPHSLLTLGVSLVSGVNRFPIQCVISLRIQSGDFERKLRGDLDLIEPGDCVRLYVGDERPLWNGDHSWFKAGVRWQVEGSNILRVKEWKSLLEKLNEVSR